jgi:hypothetical protein
MTFAMRPSSILANPARRLAPVVAGIGCLVLAACSVHASTFSSSESIDELAYSQTVRSDLIVVRDADAGLHPVCDAGGKRQGCFDASLRVVAALAALVQGLDAHPASPRFTHADTDLRRAIAVDIQGFQIRNSAIATLNNADWTKGLALIAKGAGDIDAALREYPSAAGMLQL